MIRVVAILILFSGLAHAQELTYQSEWVSCQADSDCGVVEGACGGWAGVNKKFEGPMRDYQKAQAPYVECVEFSESGSKPPVFCSEGVCHAGMDPMEEENV